MKAGLLSLTAVAIVALSSAASGPAATHVNGLTINVTYTARSLQATLSNGTALASGSVVPPGLYSLVVYDSGDDPDPQFTMTGPGVSVSSDLNPSGMGIEVPMTFGPFQLDPSSSYVISDAGLAGASIPFTTSATGTSASPNPPTPNPPTLPGKKPSRTLALAVTGSAKPLFTQGGKPVKTLAAGRYSVVVGDLSKKAGLFIGHGSAKPSTLSGVAAVGTNVRTLRLTPGTWFVEASANGPKSYFKVV
jgi:hypothetical protein